MFKKKARNQGVQPIHEKSHREKEIEIKID